MKVLGKDVLQEFQKETHMQRKFYANVPIQLVNRIILDSEIIIKELVRIGVANVQQWQLLISLLELFIIC